MENSNLEKQQKSAGKKEVIVISGSSGLIGSELIHSLAPRFRMNSVPANALWIAIISGVALIALSFPKGRIREKYGTFDKYIF